jgi:hypothetical protein
MAENKADVAAFADYAVDSAAPAATPAAAPAAAAAAVAPSALAPRAPAAAPAAAPAPASSGRLLASPVARKIAEERGIDLTLVRGTGPDGRILKEDVLSYTPPAKQAAPTPAPAPAAPTPAPAPAPAPTRAPAAAAAAAATSTYTDIPVTNMRQVPCCGLRLRRRPPLAHAHRVAGPHTGDCAPPVRGEAVHPTLLPHGRHSHGQDPAVRRPALAACFVRRMLRADLT